MGVGSEVVTVVVAADGYAVDVAYSDLRGRFGVRAIFLAPHITGNGQMENMDVVNRVFCFPLAMFCPYQIRQALT